MENKGILILSPFFYPNIGGVESHLDDLVKALGEKGYNVFVHTYSPLTTQTSWNKYEKRGKNVHIRRYGWIGKNIFHKIEKFPFFDFLYLTPYLFIRTFFWLLFNKDKINVIHAQGFNAALIGIVLKKIFHKRLVVSTHAIYELDKSSTTAKRIAWILNQADKILCVSERSYNEVLSFGCSKNKLARYTYWINLNLFKPHVQSHSSASVVMPAEAGIQTKIHNSKPFTILFVGRLIEKKGIRVLAKVAAALPQYNFVFIGTGPEDIFLQQTAQKLKNIHFLGAIPNSKLNKYYAQANIFCIPSQYEEAFGRVVMEAVACGLPVVGSNKGGIGEALDQTVSILVDPTENNLKKEIKKIAENKEFYSKLQSHCRKYAEKHFSSKNVEDIIKYYKI
jgi:phosphatidylinositol glycan class A protein